MKCRKILEFLHLWKRPTNNNPLEKYQSSRPERDGMRITHKLVCGNWVYLISPQARPIWDGMIILKNVLTGFTGLTGF